jgi:hypothetical protein
MARDMLGDTMILAPSGEAWATGRKHASKAFYKDKLMIMMKEITFLTRSRV